MSAEIMEKASELAEAIAGSEELSVMRSAEAAMNNDPQALEILEEFRKKQQQVYQLQMSGGELSDQDKKEIEVIEHKMTSNSLINAYIGASEKFENLMKGVNLIITRALSGDPDNACGTGCGTGCSPDECIPGCGCN